MSIFTDDVGDDGSGRMPRQDILASAVAFALIILIVAVILAHKFRAATPNEDADTINPRLPYTEMWKQ